MAPAVDQAQQLPWSFKMFIHRFMAQLDRDVIGQVGLAQCEEIVSQAVVDLHGHYSKSLDKGPF